MAARSRVAQRRINTMINVNGQADKSRDQQAQLGNTETAHIGRKRMRIGRMVRFRVPIHASATLVSHCRPTMSVDAYM